MVERALSLSGTVSFSDVRRIVETAKEMGDEEQLIVSMNSMDSYKAENIFSILERHNFQCSTKGGHEGTDYYIIARKKR
jgi:hypothetical protein